MPPTMILLALLRLGAKVVRTCDLGLGLWFSGLRPGLEVRPEESGLRICFDFGFVVYRAEKIWLKVSGIWSLHCVM